MATFEQIKLQIKLLPEFAIREDMGEYLLSWAVNRAQRQFHQAMNCRFEQKTGASIATTNGTRDYDVPTDYKEMDRLFYLENGETEVASLARRDKAWFDREYPDSADTGTPEDWIIWAGKIRVGPTPDTTSDSLIPHYHAYKADLANVSPNNTNDFTVQFPDALQWRAAGLVGVYAGLPDARLKVFDSLYREALADARRVVVAEGESARTRGAQTPG